MSPKKKRKGPPGKSPARRSSTDTVEANAGGSGVVGTDALESSAGKGRTGTERRGNGSAVEGSPAEPGSVESSAVKSSVVESSRAASATGSDSSGAGKPRPAARTAKPRPGKRGESLRRTPYQVDERSRWPVFIWMLLGLVWAIGVPLFLLFFVAEGFALQAEEATDEARRRLAWYLLGMVGCAVVVPLLGLGAALWLRRKIASWMFGGLAAISFACVWVLTPPWQLVAAIWEGLTL